MYIYMARSGSKTNKKRQRRAKKVGRKVPTNKTLAKRVKKIETETELKHSNTSLTNTAISNTGPFSATFMDDILQIIQGNTPTSRIANQIQTTSLQIRGQIRTISTSLLPSTCRMMVYWDKQSNGAVNSVSQLLHSGSTYAVWAPRNYANIDRFDVLWDKTIKLEPFHATDTTHVLPTAYNFNKVIKTSRIVKYQANGGAITDLAGNRLVVVFFNDGDVAGSTMVVWYCFARVYFKDL